MRGTARHSFWGALLPPTYCEFLCFSRCHTPSYQLAGRVVLASLLHQLASDCLRYHSHLLSCDVLLLLPVCGFSTFTDCPIPPQRDTNQLVLVGLLPCCAKALRRTGSLSADKIGNWHLHTLQLVVLWRGMSMRM